MRICPKCSTEHTLNGKFCSTKCAYSRIKTPEQLVLLSLKMKGSSSKQKGILKTSREDRNCVKCDALFNVISTSRQKYCSRVCSNGTPKKQTSEMNEARRQKAIGRPNPRKGIRSQDYEFRCCIICRKPFEVICTSTQTYCSKICANKSPNLGGYRDGSGRSRSGYYKGIYCGSTYELVWAIYQLDNNISFSRFEGKLSYRGVIYIPDFLQDGKIIELKGYESELSVQRKNEVAKQNGYDVIVLRKDDLIKEFEWVKINYKYKHVWELYDDHKPKYEYICNHCNVSICREYKVKTLLKFCSRKCAGLFKRDKKQKH